LSFEYAVDGITFLRGFFFVGSTVIDSLRSITFSLHCIVCLACLKPVTSWRPRCYQS
jgi:hypothetical protein